MSHAGSQQRTFLDLVAQLRPHWHRDRALPARIQTLLARNRAFGSRDRRLYRELIYTTLRYLPWIEPSLDGTPDFAAQLVAWLAADTPATRPFRAALLRDWPPCPPTLAEKVTVGGALAAPPSSREKLAACNAADLLPAWFREHCPEAFAPAQLDALLSRAPLWLRLQTADAFRVTAEFDALGWRWRPSPFLASALRVLDEVDVTQTRAYRDGLIEVQDLGSQLLLEAAALAPARGEPVESGGRWLDACAGAGGKTLQLARLLGPAGHVDAHDIRPAALAELATRAARAGLQVGRVIPKGASRKPPTGRAGPLGPPRFPSTPACSSGAPSGRALPFSTPSNAPQRPASTLRAGESLSCSSRPAAAPITLLSSPATGLYDGVLVDAPCSGSGTWRRAPHLKWTTTPAAIDEAAATQRTLLADFSERVRPGGRLIYATCSLSRRENEDVVAAFLAAHPAFTSAPFAQTFGITPRGGGLTVLPATHDTDAFFVAAFLHRP